MLLNRNPVVHDVALLMVRLIVGVVFMYHGAQKLFGIFDGPGIEGFAGFLEQLEIPQPVLMAWLTGLAEFVGGAMIFLGLIARLAAIGPLIVMAVAITHVHPHAFDVQDGGMEYPLTLAVVLAAMILAGPGRFSVDGFIMNVCCKPKAGAGAPGTSEGGGPPPQRPQPPGEAGGGGEKSPPPKDVPPPT